MCGIGSAECPTIYSEEYPKARKSHVCCECGSVISVGEKYQRVRGLWDDFATFKTCMFCADLRDKARADFDLTPDEGFPFEALWECIGIDYAAAR